MIEIKKGDVVTFMSAGGEERTGTVKVIHSDGWVTVTVGGCTWAIDTNRLITVGETP